MFPVSSMSELRSLVAPLIVLTQLAVWLTPCPGALLPATASSRAREDSPRSHPVQAAGKPEHSHQHMDEAGGSDMDSGPAHHQHASALESRREATAAVVEIPCPCGCSRSSATGRVPLSVGDFLPAEALMLEARWSQPILLGSLVELPAGPVLRVFHVPISA